MTAIAARIVRVASRGASSGRPVLRSPPGTRAARRARRVLARIVGVVAIAVAAAVAVAIAVAAAVVGAGAISAGLRAPWWW